MSHVTSARTWASWCVPLLMCVLAAGLQIAAFFPGYVTHDTAYQWWQGRHHEITTLWPPGQALLLGLFDAPGTGRGPATLYVVNSVIYWACGAYLALMQRSTALRIAVATAFCVFPTAIICLPHVWSDVSLALWLLAATLGLDFALRGAFSTVARRLLIAMCTALLLSTVLLRHNALLSLPPLLWFAVTQWHRAKREVNNAPLRTKLLPTMALLACATLVYATVPRWVSKVHADTWAITAIWDLQALSVATGKLLIPTSISADATLGDLRASYDPVNAVTLYVKSKASWANSTVGLSRDQKRDLLTAFVDAVAANPNEYMKHRFHVFAKTLSPKHTAATDGSADEPVHVEFRDNPKLAFTNPEWLQRALRWVSWLKPNWWSAPLTWMLVASGAVAVCLRRLPRDWGVRAAASLTPLPQTNTDATAAICLWVSALLYLLPLLFIAPTADLRYVLWPVVGCVAAACFALRSLSRRLR